MSKTKDQALAALADKQEKSIYPAGKERAEKQHQAVILYYQDERPVDEVAAMMGLPVNTVKTHLHRAKRLLRTRLDGADARLDRGAEEIELDIVDPLVKQMHVKTSGCPNPILPSGFAPAE